jgi:hypothetical protein
MKAAAIREPVHIGKVVRNALLFKYRSSQENPASDDALLDAVDRLFAILEERRIAYLLVGHIALLQYVGAATQRTSTSSCPPPPLIACPS